MQGEQEKHCPCCGRVQPCACLVDPRSGTITDPHSRFTLIPVLPEEGTGPKLEPEELGIPLVREAKFEILGHDLDPQDALELEKQVERLSALIQQERIQEADEVAEGCLSRVIHFPEHRHVALRRWWGLPVAFVGLVILTWIALYWII
jgi:hypothetical protein